MQQCVVHIGADMKARGFFYEEEESVLVDDEKCQEDVRAVGGAQRMQHQHKKETVTTHSTQTP